jgi:nucleoside-diphosphate-sugar epimerase
VIEGTFFGLPLTAPTPRSYCSSHGAGVSRTSTSQMPGTHRQQMGGPGSQCALNRFEGPEPVRTRGYPSDAYHQSLTILRKQMKLGKSLPYRFSSTGGGERNSFRVRKKNSLKALVTGGTGFIGSHLTEALIRKGVQVRCLLRKAGHVKWLEGLPIEFVPGDCIDKTSLEEAVRGVDCVFHLAGATKAIKKETYFDVNGFGTENLIHACLENNSRLQKFIYVSSQAAAGPSTNGSDKKESDPCEPISLYGRSKRMGEESVLAHAHELPALILRPSAVYGPRDRDIFALFKCLSRRIKPGLTGRHQRLSLCYVQDIVQGILLAVETHVKSGEVFFLSDGNAYRMEEIGDILAHTMGITALQIRVPGRMVVGIACFAEYLSKLFGRPSLLNRDKAEEIVQKEWVCDITKARALLGFEPRVPLTEGARLTFEWYKKENWL